MPNQPANQCKPRRANFAAFTVHDVSLRMLEIVIADAEPDPVPIHKTIEPVASEAISEPGLPRTCSDGFSTS